MRLSAPQMSDAFIDGARKAGADVLALGQISTDTLYFASGKYNLPGVMITASHNPKEYTGIKFCRAMAEPVGEDSGLLEIKESALNDNFENAENFGSVELKENILEEFSAHCRGFIDSKKIKKLKIVIDAGNGMAGKLAPVIFDGLPVEIVPMYFELDGNFPNHSPNPIEKQNVLALSEKVLAEKADLGLAFDGDADRVFFCDETGKMLDSSFITAMIAKNLLEKNSGGKIIYTVVVSHAVPEIVHQNGGEAILTKVGHSFIKKVMKESGAIFGGEHSGHYYFKENFRADSGVIASLIVLEMLSGSNKKLSELLSEFQLYAKSEEINSVVENKEVVFARLKEKYGANITQEFDGITFELENWWFNVRPSNTEPLLRLNLEAKTKELMEEKITEVLQIIRQ